MALSSYLSETRTLAGTHVNTAQELSRSRRELSEDLSRLSEDLVSVLSNEQGTPTLLEDLETLNRNLKELESVKTYVQVVEHALSLRCVLFRDRHENTLSTVDSEKAVEDVQSSTSITPETLQPYGTLLHFVNKAQNTTSAVEDGSGRQKVHLVTFLEHLRDKTWRDVKSILYKCVSLLEILTGVN
jgi:predicted NACHT family NTPase